ncbi:MAG TPA: diguanylate cyclase, partial [Stenomitos sp.]
LAMVASHSKDYATAQKLAHEALQDADEIGARYLSAQSHALLGELQLVQDRRSLATEHLRKALNLAEGIGSPLLHGRILRLLAEADPLRGDSLRKLAQSEADRLVAALPEAERAPFEASWHAPWVPQAQGKSGTGMTIENRLTKLGDEVDEILAQLRVEESRRTGDEQSQERLEQLIDFALKINQVHDLQLVLEMAMDLIMGIAQAERGFLLLYKEGEIEVSQLRNIRDEEAPDWRISRSIAEEVLRTEQPLCLQDALSDERFSLSQSVQALNVRTVLCVPLKIRNVVVGALYVDRQSIGNGFSERDLDVVMSLAALTATAIENANLQHEWDDKSRKLEMLNSLSRKISTTLVMEEVLDLVVQLTLEVTTAERGFLLLWEQDRLNCRAAFKQGGERLDPQSQTISHSICQQVLDSGQSLCVEDASSDEQLQVQASIMDLNLRTVMCVPLIAKQTVLGLLYVDSQAIVNHFTERDLELLEAIANHASVAIENAHLYTQLARRASELENLVMLYEEANLRASTDALTGLHNRRFFQDQLNRDFAQARRHRRHLSVIMLDIDHFKSFNDTFGHGLGDQVLQSVSVVLGQAVRLADVVARYGGEEFIVSLPDTDFEGALIVAERIRRSVSEIELTDAEDNPLRQITVSLGVSSLRLEDERIAELIERADRGLYMAKVKGRNQVQWVED